MESLPRDLLIRISDCLSTKERARLAVVSKEWQQVVSDSWTAITIQSRVDLEFLPTKLLLHLQQQLDWLSRLAIKNPNTLRSLHIRAWSSYAPDLQLHRFSRLQSLSLHSSLMTPTTSRYPLTFSAQLALQSPKLMQCLTAMQQLEVLDLHVDEEYFSLDVLADLPRLQKLHLQVFSHTELLISPPLHDSSFLSLEILLITTGSSPVTLDREMMAAVVRRLKHLHIDWLQPILPEMEAPKLEVLHYRLGQLLRSNANALHSLPLRTSSSLRSLFCTMMDVPLDLPIVSRNIAVLHLEAVPGKLTADVVRSWASMTSLTQLTISRFEVVLESIMQPFTSLTGLKSLCLKSFLPKRGSHRIFGEFDGSMPVLTSLRLYAQNGPCTYHAENMAQNLPALQTLCARMKGHIVGDISSGVQGKQSSSSIAWLHQPQDPQMGQFQYLRILSLCAIPTRENLEEQANRGYSIDALLRTLSSNVRDLRALKLVTSSGILTLSLVKFPHLEALVVACKAVNFDCSSLPSQDCYIDLHFTEASDATIDRFQACQACQEVTMTTAVKPRWKHINVRRGSMPTLQHIIDVGSQIMSSFIEDLGIWQEHPYLWR